MKVTKELAQELLEMSIGDDTTDKEFWECEQNLKMVHTDLIDTSRWSNIHEVVYEDLDTGKFWYSHYSVGATECQDESPYEYDDDIIEFTEVTPVQVTVTEYKVVK